MTEPTMCPSCQDYYNASLSLTMHMERCRNPGYCGICRKWAKIEESLSKRVCQGPCKGATKG